MKIGILGGGLTGLYAAYRLKNKGYDCILYEKDRLGGRLAYGLKAVSSDYQPRFYKLIRELDLDSSLRYFSKDMMGVYDDSVEYFYDFSSLISDLPEEEIDRYKEIEKRALKADFDSFNTGDELLELAETSLGDYLGEVGSEFLRRVVCPVLDEPGPESIDLERISADYFLFRLRAVLEYGNEESQIFSQDEGAEAVSKALADSIKGEVEVEFSEVVELDPEAPRVTLENGEQNSFDVMISALPLKALREINPELSLGGGIYYKESVCHYVEGDRITDEDLIFGFGDNMANLGSYHHVDIRQHQVYPAGGEGSVDFEVLFENFLEMEDPEETITFPVFEPGAEMPDPIQGKTFFCGDFYRYPYLETVVRSVDRTVNTLEEI